MFTSIPIATFWDEKCTRRILIREVSCNGRPFQRQTQKKSDSRAPSNSDCFQLTSIGPNLRLRHILVQWKFLFFLFFSLFFHLVVMLNSFNGHSFSFQNHFFMLNHFVCISTSLTVFEHYQFWWWIKHTTNKKAFIKRSQGRLTIFFVSFSHFFLFLILRIRDTPMWDVWVA